MLNQQKIRSDFPVLAREVHPQKPLVYMDSAATAQKPTAVIESMNAFYRQSNANTHRGIHVLAEEATALYEQARLRIANFIGARSQRQVVFTRNTTESINLVAHAWGRKFFNAGDLVLLSEMEHHSNMVPWFMLAREKGIKIEYIPLTEQFTLDLEKYQQLLQKSPKLVAIAHMSNVLGTINPVKVMADMAHRAGALMLVDGAQSVPHFAVDANYLEVDFMAFSAHKMCGPTGIGVLYAQETLLEKMDPFLGGGDMIKKVTFEDFYTNEIPYKFEAGTPAIAEVIGFGAAVDYLSAIGMDAIAEHEKELTHYALEMLGNIKWLQIYGPPLEYKGGVISFSVNGIHPHDVAQVLDSEGIAIRAGHHCAMPLHQKLGIAASSRASLYLYNTREEVDKLVIALNKLKQLFSRDRYNANG